MKWIILAAALLVAGSALAASPTIGNSGGDSTGYTFNGTTNTRSITTAHANAIILIAVASTAEGKSSASTVTSVADGGSAGLVFHKRGTSYSQNTTCVAGSSSPCSLGFELWWATALTTVSSESITVTVNQTTNLLNFSWFEIDGTFNPSNPFDTNISIPVVNNGVSSTPNGSGLSTTQAHDLLFSFSVTGQNGFNNYTPCPITSWTAGGVNTSIGNQQSTESIARSVSSPTTLTANMSNSGSGGCPTGTSSGTGTNWVILWDALTGDAPPSSTFLPTATGPMAH